MTILLQQLARDGDISWLSYYFAEFISARDGSQTDDLVGLSAALVSEANLAGNVCVELGQFNGRPLFQSSRSDGLRMPLGRDTAEWTATLLTSVCVGIGGQHSPLIIDDSRLYLNRYWFYENFVSEKILSLLHRESGDDSAQINTTAEALFAEQQDIDKDQMEAVAAAAGKPFSVISGGPGSGKTSTVIRILAVLLAHNPGCRIALAAPTGKAAARMMDSIRQRIDQLDIDDSIKSAIPVEARTIHRLLGYRHHGFGYHQQHRLPLDCVVIDEASMIDLKLMYQLLSALPDEAQLILLGDRDQLASVAAGNVLGDITGHGHRLDSSEAAIASATSLLRSNYRFGRDSGIGELARLVKLGDAGAAGELLRANQAGLRWFDEAGEQVHNTALDWLYDAYQPIFDSATPAQALDAYDKTRLLCATNRGPFGVERLNSQVSSAMLARNQRPESTLFARLPIMITRNFQALGLFNGDTGILWSFDDELRACFRDADGSIRDLSINRLPEFKPAWASTVHKSQGSEFDSVLLVLPADPKSEVLSRELVYTGITRARQQFLLHAPDAILTQAITRLTRRHSGLATKLGWSDGEPVTA
ncbi:MAG TPA: exodeoxyribonuclease V subunit alpha [Gammaproteobacteria bacterium]|nr:exodeoxyribonuclease V subunit alpha [Gammaproteobacteria bacterium]